MPNNSPCTAHSSCFRAIALPRESRSAEWRGESDRICRVGETHRQDCQRIGGLHPPYDRSRDPARSRYRGGQSGPWQAFNSRSIAAGCDEPPSHSFRLNLRVPPISSILERRAAYRLAGMVRRAMACGIPGTSNIARGTVNRIRLAHPSGRGLRMTCEPRSAQRILMLCLAAAVGLVFSASASAQESWDAIYLGGSKIGHVHTYVEKVKNQGRDYLRVRIDMEQRIKRGKDIAVTRLTYGTIETPEGQVLRLDTLIDAGEQTIRTHGDVIRGEIDRKSTR